MDSIFCTSELCEIQGNVWENLSFEERKALDAMFDDNALNLIENILQGLAIHQSPSLFEPHPFNSKFNLIVQDLIKKYRNQIEL